jgi:hypothetical protein
MALRDELEAIHETREGNHRGYKIAGKAWFRRIASGSYPHLLEALDRLYGTKQQSVKAEIDSKEVREINVRIEDGRLTGLLKLATQLGVLGGNGHPKVIDVKGTGGNGSGEPE